MSRVGRTQDCDWPEAVSILFPAWASCGFFRTALSDLADKAVAIDDLWGPIAFDLTSELCELDEVGRIDRLESALLARLRIGRQRTSAVNVGTLAATILRRRGQMTVEDMAQAAGVSRQHLSRDFRERIGITPKLYSRLARFQSSLVYAGHRAGVDWACAATEMGYADQSHMIAELRRFSGLTPQVLASRNWFHPFIERAISSRGGNAVNAFVG